MALSLRYLPHFGSTKKSGTVGLLSGREKHDLEAVPAKRGRGLRRHVRHRRHCYLVSENLPPQPRLVALEIRPVTTPEGPVTQDEVSSRLTHGVRKGIAILDDDLSRSPSSNRLSIAASPNLMICFCCLDVIHAIRVNLAACIHGNRRADWY